MSQKTMAWSNSPACSPTRFTSTVVQDSFRRHTTKPVRHVRWVPQPNTCSRAYVSPSHAVHSTVRNPLGQRAKQKQADREFFADLLSSAATKRDAKVYLSRLRDPPIAKPTPTPSKLSKPRVNLGTLFGRSRAVDTSPVFSQYELEEDDLQKQETLHVALVKISNVGKLSDGILLGLAETLTQLSRLYMAPCVVLESDDTTGDAQKDSIEQADRLVTAIDSVSEDGARRVDNILTVDSDGTPKVFLRKLLLRPLRKGRIPVVLPTAYSEEQQKAVQISANEAVLAITKEFAGLNVRFTTDEEPQQSAAILTSIQRQVSLDRIIVIDEAGGIPDSSSNRGGQVFVNLEQEYPSLQARLTKNSDNAMSQRHKNNLTLLRNTLQLLPPTSSGLMATHRDAANTSRVEQDLNPTSVGTRRQKNALIHNLLTDKPAYSASLPAGRLTRSSETTPPVTVSTFVKRGMPLTILPDPTMEVWKPDAPRIKLTDSRIDLGRLVYLIDDSFNRKLDIEHYLNRVNDRIAGVIIAGNYEGGALLTWETPPGADPKDRSRLVPYLDKFAVLKRSQGAGGVADIVFNAMVRDCFPNGVCWRSRKDNPVNKWYFERSRGTWKIPDMNWTMFWTTPGVSEHDQAFTDYEGVCRGVEPSWANKKQAAD